MLLMSSSFADEPATARISLAELEDKIRGGWAGQMIGVSYGTPTEFRWLGKLIEDEIPWIPEMVQYSIRQDDCYVEMTFAEVMDRIGLDATTEQYGEAFKNSKYNLWHANAAARRLLNIGIKAPMSGHPDYNLHANDIDFQIEADFIGLMTPGLPQESNKYCDRVGHVMNYGDGVYGGMFVCGMYAAGFFERDVRKVVEAGLACLPPESGYADIIRDTLALHSKHPDDWRAAWSELNAKWDKDDPCPDGALRPFNIDARLNGAYIAIGLLYSGGDFGKCVEITTRCGQDSDCNPSNSAGILGTMIGYKAIPEIWKSGIPKIENAKFDYTNYSMNDIVRSTLERAKKVIVMTGGEVTETEAIVKLQKPVPARLEQFDMGIPTRRIDVNLEDWSWGEGWIDDRDPNSGRYLGKASTTPGAEATLEFQGAAIAIAGYRGQNGGRADVFIDGEKRGEIDSYIIERTADNDLFHIRNLKPGVHTLKIVMRGDADARSQGKRVHLGTAITFDSR